jgi:hypothetical protein
MRDLIIGKSYKKSDFGIRFPLSLRTNHVIGDERYCFVSLGGRFHNKITDEGLLAGLRHARDWGKNPPTEHVFVRNGTSGPFTYLGFSGKEKLIAEKKVLVIMDIRDEEKVTFKDHYTSRHL